MITRVNKLMSSNIVFVRMGTPVLDAYNTMKDKKIRHLPVVDELGDVVGILSQRDLSTVMNPSAITVDMLMKTPVEFVEHDLPTKEAVARLLDLRISCLLLTKKAEVIGIVTTDDLLRFLHQLLSETEQDPEFIMKPERLQTIGKVADSLAQIGI